MVEGKRERGQGKDRKERKRNKGSGHNGKDRGNTYIEKDKID
jgi:hypothetical protein